jgi:hypothetical protein
MKIVQDNFTAKECSVMMKYLFLRGNSAKKIYDTHMSVKLGDKCLLTPQSRTGLLDLEQDIWALKTNILGD